MFDAIAGWFVAGMFVAGLWIVATSLMPASAGRPAIEGNAARGTRSAGLPPA